MYYIYTHTALSNQAVRQVHTREPDIFYGQRKNTSGESHQVSVCQWNVELYISTLHELNTHGTLGITGTIGIMRVPFWRCGWEWMMSWVFAFRVLLLLMINSEDSSTELTCNIELLTLLRRKLYTSAAFCWQILYIYNNMSASKSDKKWSWEGK